MSYPNYQQTNGHINNSPLNSAGGSGGSTQERASFSVTSEDQPSGTGAIKKNTKVYSRNNKTNRQSHKPNNTSRQNYRSCNFSDNENMPYNHSEISHHSSRRHDYDSHVDRINSRRTGYRGNLNSDNNSQYLYEEPLYRSNSSLRTIRNHVRNPQYHEDRNTESNSDAPNQYGLNEAKVYNLEKDNVQHIPDPSINGNYKSRNSKYYTRENSFGGSSGHKVNKHGYYRNSKQRNYQQEKESFSKGNVTQKKHRNEKLLKKGQGEVASQRERLEGMIKQRTLECLVCCELLKNHNEVWSCKQCYHILHLKCIRAWANSSKVNNGWRCPACQNVCEQIPADYLCFCGKMKNPRNMPGFIAHSCGEVCLKNRRSCDHRCSILCHPGPCPDCTILVDKSCGCGKTKQQVMCYSEQEIICTNQCEKLLECGVHKCSGKCHSGDCKPCEEILHQNCFCTKKSRDVTCSFEFEGNTKYSCEGICERTLECNNHKCLEICHSGPCKPCKNDCRFIKTCFCGKKSLEVPRTSCLDPIPSCGWLCQKSLKCGPSTAHHKCESICHEGDCPPCNLTTILRCRCGSMNKEVSCIKLVNDDCKCERKCSKKRLCGKHKCNQRCCIEIEHICPLPCNKILSCGNHRCELTCHSGRCKPCMETSFEELYCECGSAVMYPPIPCGTRPPVCDKPCSRSRECGHDVNHACHTGSCPPCTVLCKRWCYGKHEQRGAIPCYQEEFSCGLPCGKPMPCGRHKCNSPCHTGSCPLPCKQPCVFERSSCGHPCLAACHETPCPKTVCKSKVSISCICGVQKGVRTCNEVIDEIRNIEMAQLSEKMLNMMDNQTVDISDMSKTKRPDVLKILECTDECRVIERNRRLAIGLQIRNPDITQKLTPRYSDFLRGWAKKDPNFCQKVHNKLTELVQLAKQSQQRSRAYSFESMNRDKRQFVHEYCEHFGCESEAYDSEPNRNVVATAIRDKSWLPSMSLLEVIQRENGQRKVPMPSHLERNFGLKSESVTLKPLNKIVRLGVSMSDVEFTKK